MSEHRALNHHSGFGLAGLDPGRSKCGLVRTDAQLQTIVAAAVLDPATSLSLLQRWQNDGLKLVILGDGTGSGLWRSQLQGLGLDVVRVNEQGTTLAARQRYWQLENRWDWRRWLPEGLRLPPRDIDDIVAQLLVERHLGHPLQRGPLPVWRQLHPAAPRNAPSP